MTMTDDAAAPAKAPPPPEARVEVDPNELTLDAAGQCRRHWFVRLPEAMVADDIKDPAIWKRVQDNRDKSLMRFDEIFAVSYREDWFATGVVTEVTQSGAVLGAIRIASIEPRLKAYMNDGVYKVEWRGNGFVVIRIKAGQQMTNPVQSEAVANEELVRLYPQRMNQ